ncbi:MAG: Cys-Gln thioester bond-forming surface protein [Clostridia bacterium]|nr:Cys-Gln thioester bond-forming surface protein [Clostridia bacterium]
MKKSLQRIIAATLIFCLCVTILPVSALAAEDGLVTDAETITDTRIDDEGNTIVTVILQEKTQGTTADGVAVSKEETVTHIAKTDPNGNVLGTSHVEEGTESREWDEKVKPGEEMGEVKVQLRPGEGASEATEHTYSDITGDEQHGPNDKEYDYKKTEVTINRTVTATAGEINTAIERAETRLESIKAEDYEGKDPNVFGPDLDFVAGTADAVPQPEEEGYDYQLVGYGDATNELKVLRDYITYEKTDGKPVTDAEGNFIIEKVETKLDNTPMQIALRKDENGEYEYFFGYCIDSDTEAGDGAWYKVANLEDSDYYPNPDSAAKLRAVVTNGYWGTEMGKGSVEQIKEMIKEVCGPDAVITVDTDDNGGKATYKIVDIIDSLTEAEALAATQAAIWSFANGDPSTKDGKDGYIAHGPVNVKRSGGSYMREYLPESDARAMAVFNWLRSLAPIEDSDEEVITIINEKNAVGDMWLTVRDKAKDYAQNMDDDSENDVYNTELNFTLAFVPDPEKDDLLVYLMDAEGNPIRDKEGEPVIRRLAGENSEERRADTIHPDENGVYTLSGLQLSENSDFKLDLRLEGAQYLKEGVYIYTAHGGVDKSQSIVGIAEGTHTVDVSVGMTVRFEGDENKHVAEKRIWRTQSNTGGEPPKVDTTPEPSPKPPKHDHIVDPDEIYLARPVKTGDVSYVLAGMALASAIGLMGVLLAGRKANKN